MDRKNGDTPDEDDGKQPCPYCQKRLKHINIHKSRCPQKPQDRTDCTTEDDVPTLLRHQEYKYELSLNLIVHQESKKDRKNSDTSDEDDGKQPCPYCQKRLKHVNIHKSNCPNKPQDRPECTEEDVPTLQGNQEYASSSNSIVHQESKKDRKNSEDDGKQPCPYCQKRLKNVNKHKSNCPNKPQDRPECTEEDVPTLQGNQEYASSNSIVHQESKDRKNSDTFDEDDGKQPFPYCQKRLKHVNIHKSRCPKKPQSSFEDKNDDGKKPGPYCQKRCLDDDDEDDDDDDEDDEDDDDDDEDEDDDDYDDENDESLMLNRCTNARKKFKKKVQLKQEDIHNNIKINDLMKNVMKELNVCRPLKWKKFNSGSYYSYVKVATPNEFDYLLCSTLVKCRIVQDSSSPNYCRVFVTNRKQLPLDFRELLGTHDELSPSKFKEYVFKVFDLGLKEMNNRRLVKISTGSTCPAYTVEYKYGTQIKYSVDIDWIPCLEVENKPDSCMEWKTKKLTDEEKMDTKILVIPKNLATTNGENRELWRLSYSTFEKKIIREKCKPDDRLVIRILKNIVTDENDHNSKIGSYHITNHCLHMFEKIGQRPELQEYTIQAIDSFISRLQSRDLPYFFISSINLLQNVDEKECQKMIEKMKKYKEQWTDK